MLTNADLRKIGEVIDQRLETKLEEKLESKLEEKFESKLAPIKKDIEVLKKSDRKIRKDLRLILKFFDRERFNHEKRIARIEDHLHLPSIE